MQLRPENISVDPLPSFSRYGIEASVLRLDKIHPVISGNKWFKLRYYIEEAKTQNTKTIVTFGGPYSNHIIACAAACRLNGFAAVGIIRGEEPSALSYTLQKAKEFGMQLHFSNRNDYAEKKIPDPLLNEGNYIIPEGGYGWNGVKGAGEILNHVSMAYTHYCCAVGTGTMIAGIINSIPGDASVIGISVMKNNNQLEGQVASLVLENRTWQIIHDYHFGGYAKYTSTLLGFINEIFRETTIPSDFVYTGKLFYGINDLAAKGFFPLGSRILLVHSGGLQGNASLEKGTLIF